MTATDPIVLALDEEVVQAEALALVLTEKKPTQAELRKLYNKNYYEMRKASGELCRSQTREYRNEYIKQYMQTEKGKQMQKDANARFSKNHPGFKRELYLKNREHQLAQQKVYYQINREAINQKARSRRLAKQQVADDVTQLIASVNISAA